MSPIDIQDVFERARGSARVGDHEEAERLLKQYLSKVPGSRDAHLLLGATLARAGKLVEAADEFTTLIAKNPRDVEALNNLAVIYRRQDKLQDALGALMEAIDIDPTRAEFHYNVGNIHKQLGNLKAASMAYAKVVELDPKYVSAYNNLGTIYDKLREWEKAFNVFRKGLALDQNNPTLHFNYGIALESNGRLEDAAGEYRATLRSKPGWLEAMNNLGIVLFKQGQHNKAMEIFNRVLHIDPFNAETRNNIGVVLSDQGRNKEAIRNFRQALESDPKYVKAVINLERVLEDQGDVTDAVVELEKLVKLVPDSAEIRNRLASLYLKLERYPEALEQAKAAQEWEPENVQSLRLEGTVQRVLGNDDEAKANFEKVLSLDPGNYAFHLDLADIHFRRKEYKEAEDRIMAFLARKPNDRAAKLLLGKLYAEMGNRVHAIQIFEELAKADPNDTEALAAAAGLHKEAGSLEKALRAADKLVNLQGKRATSDDLSDLNKSLEFYENAVNAYSSSVKEMWDRNMKIMTETAEAGGTEENEDVALLFGAAGMAPAVDEELEALFIEDMETPEEAEEDIAGDLVLDDDGYSVFGEDQDTSLDNLAEHAPAESSPPGNSPNMPPSPEPDSGSQGPLPETPVPQQAPASAPQASVPPPQAPAPPPEVPAPPPQVPAPPPEVPAPPPQVPAPPPQVPAPPPQVPAPSPQVPASPPQAPEADDREIPWDAEPEEDYTVIDEGEESLGEETGENGTPGETGLSEEPAAEEEVEFPQEPVAEEEGIELPEEPAPEEEEFEFPPGPVPGEEAGLPEEPVFGEEEVELPGEPVAEEEGIEFPQEPEEEELEFPPGPVPGGEAGLPEEPVLGEEELEFPEEPVLEGEEELPGEPAAEEAETGLSGEPVIPGTEAKAPQESRSPGRIAKTPGEVKKADLIGLMRYLKGLADSLPNKNRDRFVQSDARLSMEFIIDSLEGRKGLFREIQDRLPIKPVHAPEKPEKVKPADVTGTLAFLGKLAAALPDRDLTAAITRKVDTVITGIHQSIPKSGDNHEG